MTSPKFPDHDGKATWGDRVVPLEAFREAAAGHGVRLDAAGRIAAREKLLALSGDGVVEEGPWERIVVFGGVYNNYAALEALLERPEVRRADAVYCLGDLGGFGPHPERIRPLLVEGGALAIQGNYEQSLAGGAEDCNCGYTDPRDNHFAALSYSYTDKNVSPEFREWMGALPARRRVVVGGRRLLLVHGSPRRVNEFLFASTTPAPYLEVLFDREACDAILCTHTGLDWQRRLASGRDAVNVGVIGRPPNDGGTAVRFAEIVASPSGIDVALHRLDYDHAGLAREMRREGLPAEFVETILTGWWTSCLEILPARERARSRY